ncbi:MAG: hypothetical protein ACE5K0_00070 [Candidatus Methanofastidiosia archaeon]
MVKKRLKKLRKSYESYLKFIAKLLLTATPLAILFLIIMIFLEVEGFKDEVLKLSELSDESQTFNSLFLKDFLPEFLSKISYLKILSGFLLLSLFILKRREIFKRYVPAVFISGGILGLAKPLLEGFLQVENLSKTASEIGQKVALGEETQNFKDYFLKIFLYNYSLNLFHLFIFLGFLSLGIYLISKFERREFAEKICTSIFLTAAIFGILYLGLNVYNESKVTQTLLEIYREYEDAGQFEEGTVAKFIATSVVPQYLKFASDFLLYLGFGFLAFFYMTSKTSFRRYSGISIFFGASFATFWKLLNLGKAAQLLRNERFDAINAISQGEPFQTQIGSKTIELTSMKGFYIEKFAATYLDEISKLLIFFALIILGIYVYRRET